MQEENATHLNQLAAIYCRVSSERQEKEGTIQSQIAELESIAKQNGDTIVERYLDDGYSGELLERPALDKLRNDAAKRIFGKVYILSPDRLARKHHYAAIVLEDLARFGVQVIFSTRPVGESVEDRLLFDIQSVFADYEKAKILDRLRRGKIFKIKQGNVVGNVAPTATDM
jgi:site-specific DNA recombinase